MKTAIITGANGFIGSHLLHRLLARGWCVKALGRGTTSSPWRTRLLEAAAGLGSADDLPGQLNAIEVDIALPIPELLDRLHCESSPPDTILYHIAGDTRFRPTDPESQRAVNVQAPLNLLSALKGGIGRMVHVSTAYVAGKRSGLIREEELDCGQEFWNPYEKSKLDAELALVNASREAEVPLVILRPAIIINDRSTGQASTFTHLNALVEVVSRLQDYYGLADGEVVSKRIRLMADPQAKPNLAPIDSILPPMIQIAESPAAPGRCFHLCHPRPQTNEAIMNSICEAYGVRSRLALEFVARMTAPLSHTEEMVARSLKVYSPYLNSRLEFDLTNSRSIVPDFDSRFSPLDTDYLRKVIQFQRRKHNARRAGLAGLRS